MLLKILERMLAKKKFISLYNFEEEDFFSDILLKFIKFILFYEQFLKNNLKLKYHSL